MANNSQIDYFSEQIKNHNLYKRIGLKKSNYREFNISKDDFKKVEGLKELRLQYPNIVIAKSILNAEFIQNNFSKQKFKKGNNYVMSIDLFESMQYDPKRKFKKTNKNLRILKPSEVKFKKIYRKYEGQDLNNKSLLIWRTGGIGDLLFIKPNLDYLKEKYPTCKIKFACSPLYQSMVKEWKCVDAVLNLPFVLQHLITCDYHCVFEGVIERTYEAEKVNAYQLFTRWMNLNLSDDKLIPKQTPNEKIVRECKNILYKEFINKKEFILIQVRASSPPRTPPPSFWIKLINKLTDEGHKIVLTDTPNQYKNLVNLKEQCRDQNNIFVFSKESKTIAHLISIASLAKLVISPDSSLLHIGESIGVKNFGIYGPFLGHVRMSTYKHGDWIDSTYKCAPCFVHNHNPCKNSIKGYSPCYDGIDINKCIDKINGLLK